MQSITEPVITIETQSNKEQMALELFQMLSWNFQLTQIKDILVPQHMQEVLLAVDYEYFDKITFPQLKLAHMIPIVKQYMQSTFQQSFTTKVEKELISQNLKTWLSLIIYLFGNCPMKSLFIQKIIDCSTQAQEYYMILMGEFEENIQFKDESETKLQVIDELENQLREKTQELMEIKNQLQNLRQENTQLKSQNLKLGRNLTDFLIERAEQLDSVNVGNMDQLLQLYKQALDINDKLSTQLQRFEDQNSHLQEMYSGISQDLIIAKYQNEEKESRLRTRVSTMRKRSTFKGLRFATNSDSDEQVSYMNSIEMHTKPLKEQIGHLDRYSKNLKHQMRMLYREFTKLTTELKPFKDDGMFQEVPRSLF